MPLWVIYHTPTVFTQDKDKQALAADITTIYTSIGMPAFYVVVEFVQVAGNNTYVGGESRETRPFIRITTDHIAGRLPDDDEKRLASVNGYSAKLKPHMDRQGSDWEFHIDETDRRLWRVNGLVPPGRRSAGEALWAKENKPVDYSTAEESA